MNPETTSPQPVICRTCGQALTAAELDGLCVRCLWQQLITSGEDERSTAGQPNSAPGLRIPGYEVIGEISRGGMGIVYRARQLHPPRFVALKMLLPHQAGSAEMRERFRLEIRASASLDHAAILPIYHVAEHDGLPFYTMKLATGGTLAERNSRLRNNFREIAQLLVTLAEAVQFAHERGVLHRDLKPGNILFDEAGRAHVSDFGLAKFTEELEGKTGALTRSISVLGTPQYMAPEIAAEGPKAATTAADLYSLGAILYELLAGRPPFEADSVTALMKRVAEEEPTAPSAAKRPLESPGLPAVAVPRDLEIICLKCLAKEPARRYATTQDLANDLRHWLAGEAIEARETKNLERIWLWSKRHRVTASLLATVFLLTITLLVGLTVATVRVSESQRAALRTVESLESQKANDLFAAGGTTEAITLLARRVRGDPDNWADCERLMSALQRRTWAVPTRAPVKLEVSGENAGENNRTFLIKEDGDRLLALSVGTNLTVYDVMAGTNRHVWTLPFPVQNFLFDVRHSLFLVASNGVVRFLDYRSGRWLHHQLEVSKRFAYPPVNLQSPGWLAFLVAPDSAGELLDLETGLRRRLSAPPPEEKLDLDYPVGSFFPRSPRLAFTDSDRTIHIFDYAKGTVLDVSITAASRVSAIEISPDERVLVTQGTDQKQFWNLENGRELPKRAEIGVSLNPGAFEPNGSTYYLAANAAGLVTFDALSGQISKLPLRGILLNGLCRPDSANARVAVQFERFVGVYDGQTLQALCQPIPVSQARECPVQFANEGCVTVDRDGQLTLWGIGSNRLGSISMRHTAAVQSASFSPNGKMIVTASHDGTAKVWDSFTGQPVGSPMTHMDKVWSACFSPDGNRIATASWDASARIWDAKTGKPASPPLRASHFVFHVQYSPDGSRLLACGPDTAVQIYDATSGKLIRELVEQGAVYWASFSPDGELVATRPRNANPKLWNVNSGLVVKELVEPWKHGGSATVVTRGDFSRDGSWLALGSADRQATIWHLPEGKLQSVLSHAAVVRTATFTHNAKTLLTTADDLTAQLWNVPGGKAKGAPMVARIGPDSPPNTGNSLRAAAIHADGLRAVTGGSDATARGWDVRNGNPLGEPMQFDGSVMSAEFSPDGRRLLVACFDGSAHVLQLPPVVDRAPDWLAPLAEALVGQRFNDAGAVESVSSSELWELCETLRLASKDDTTAQWAKAWLGL